MRIKTDSKQFEMKEAPIEEEGVIGGEEEQQHDPGMEIEHVSININCHLTPYKTCTYIS